MTVASQQKGFRYQSQELPPYVVGFNLLKINSWIAPEFRTQQVMVAADQAAGLPMPTTHLSKQESRKASHQHWHVGECFVVAGMDNGNVVSCLLVRLIKTWEGLPGISGLMVCGRYTPCEQTQKHE